MLRSSFISPAGAAFSRGSWTRHRGRDPALSNRWTGTSLVPVCARDHEAHVVHGPVSHQALGQVSWSVCGLEPNPSWSLWGIFRSDQSQQSCWDRPITALGLTWGSGRCWALLMLSFSLLVLVRVLLLVAVVAPHPQHTPEQHRWGEPKQPRKRKPQSPASLISCCLFNSGKKNRSCLHTNLTSSDSNSRRRSDKCVEG